MAYRASSTLRTALLLFIAIGLAALPFELASGFGLGSLLLTNVEALVLVVLALWAALLASEKRAPAAPWWLTAGAAAVCASLLLSAALAETERLGALKFALRQAQGALLALCLADTLRRYGGARAMLGALLGGAALSAALGLLESGESPLALALLAPFKTEATYMGGLLRLSGTFSYANTAAQYFEALLPMLILVAAAARGIGRPWRIAALIVAPLMLIATLLTFSRAALGVTALLLLLTPLAAWRFFDAAAAQRTALCCAGLALVGLGLAAASPTFRLRVTEPEVGRWYGASYTVFPMTPMAPNEVRQVPITITNTGMLVWDPDGLRPVRLAYHWLDATNGTVVRYEGRRTVLPGPVAPGESLTLTATVQAPERPGRYVLVWDMLREYIGRGWFSQMGVATARLPVAVSGVAASEPPPAADSPYSPKAVGVIPGPPGRRELWGAALTMWRERPLLGIGPDVFRHSYGPRLGLTAFDDRVHTNNLYLELLTGAGVTGLLSFLALAGASLWVGWRSAGAHQDPAATTLLAGAWLGIVAFLGHGSLDVFLAFTPTYALLWALLGAIGGLTIRGDEIRFASGVRIPQKAR